jgi:hypothetical protein
MAKILVSRAERGLWEAFERDGWRLTEIARDPAVLGAEPYRAFSPRREIAFRVCLARAEGEAYRVIDGIHRAIQMARNGDKGIPLCVLHDM